MKKLIKKEKGITLITLVITIVIMLILASITVGSGINLYKNSIMMEYLQEMQLIQAKVDEACKEKNLESLLNLGKELNENQSTIINIAFNNNEISSNDLSKYRYFSINDLKEIFNIDNAVKNIMINFETREIVSEKGIVYDDITYYTQYKLPGGQMIVNNEGNDERNAKLKNFDWNNSILVEIEGITARIIVKEIPIANCTLSYKEVNDNYWQIINNYTEIGESYTIDIAKMGSYKIKLQDNTNKQMESETRDAINITLANKPNIKEGKLSGYDYGGNSLNWAYSECDGKKYVWIPRFAYDKKNNNSIKYIKETSNIATDNTFIGTNDNNHEWIIPENFKNSENDLTGIWVEVTTTENLDMITLIEDETLSKKELIEIIQ